MRKLVTPDATLVQEFVYTQQQLPTHKPVVQHIRQSTRQQLKRNKQSYELQDSDLRRKLTRGYGWQDNDEFIIKIDSDQGKSGTKRRDERSGLERLYTLLESDMAGAVAAFDVSRLYRVLSRAEYGGFCDLMLAKQIPVITDQRIYWPTRVDNDQLNDDFRVAAMYIEDIIKGKLIAAKNRHIQYDVSYAGNAVPFGYIVLDMGSETADRKFYTIYEPHAILIRWLFRRFRELGGNLPLLGKELGRVDFHFPAFDPGISPHVGLKVDKDGTYPLRTRAALISILTNKSYIGWYEYSGMIVSRKAHDPIVDMDDFMFAYERLSGRSLDGKEQVERMPRERRYGGAGALLDGIVTSEGKPVYVIRDKYMTRTDNDGWTTTELVVNVDTIDNAVSPILIMWLNIIEKSRKHNLHSKLSEQVLALQQEQTKQATDYTKAIARIDDEIGKAEMAQRVSKSLGDEHGYTENTKQLVQLRNDRAAIKAKADSASSEASELAECHTLIGQAIEQWNCWDISKRKRLVRLLHTRANMTEASPHFIRLDVSFALGSDVTSYMTLYIYRTRGSRQVWSEQEDSLLQRLYQGSASKADIMQALPTRTWDSCQQRAQDYGLRYAGVEHDASPLCYADMVLMQETGARTDRVHWITTDETGQDILSHLRVPVQGLHQAL